MVALNMNDKMGYTVLCDEYYGKERTIIMEKLSMPHNSADESLHPQLAMGHELRLYVRSWRLP